MGDEETPNQEQSSRFYFKYSQPVCTRLIKLAEAHKVEDVGVGRNVSCATAAKVFVVPGGHQLVAAHMLVYQVVQVGKVVPVGV